MIRQVSQISLVLFYILDIVNNSLENIKTNNIPTLCLPFRNKPIGTEEINTYGSRTVDQNKLQFGQDHFSPKKLI